MRSGWIVVLLALASGCTVVPRNRRARLVDPIMRFEQDGLEAHKRNKFHSTRSGAAGGDGEPAGGGCSCQ